MSLKMGMIRNFLIDFSCILVLELLKGIEDASSFVGNIGLFYIKTDHHQLHNFYYFYYIFLERASSTFSLAYPSIISM